MGREGPNIYRTLNDVEILDRFEWNSTNDAIGSVVKPRWMKVERSESYTQAVLGESVLNAELSSYM